MEYNTEMLTALAQQLTDTFKRALTEHVRAGGAEPTMADIETEMRQMLRQVGGQALSLFLSTALDTPAAEIVCECGGKLHYQRFREATLTSVFGKISYERAYYAGCPCGQGQAPLDDKYGLTPGAVSSGLAALIALSGVEFAFDESRKWLQRFLLFEVSENTVRSETQTFGDLQVARETVAHQHSQDEDQLQTRQREVGERPPRLYGSIDAAKVRIEPRTAAEKQAPDRETWRDLKLGCWYEVETVPPAQRSTRQRDTFAREQVALRAKNIRYYYDITEAEAFGWLLWASGCTAQADLVRELVFVCDGALWIWNLIAHYYPHAVQIVDWYHAAERLKVVAHAALTNEADRRQWLEQQTQDLWEGRVESVRRACTQLAPRCAVADQAVTYFTHHAARMKYDQFRAAGYLIGSGTVESGCKQIVTQRLKQPGAQWTVTGAVKTAKARAAWLSGEWDILCTQRAALPLAV
jgi:hypothetical protein